MASRRLQIATRLSTLRARLVQRLDCSSVPTQVLRRVSPRQFGERAPRGGDSATSEMRRLARPIRFPQRGHGRPTLSILPAVGTEAFVKLRRSARRARAVCVASAVDPDPSGARSLTVLAAAGACIELPDEGIRWQGFIDENLRRELGRCTPGDDLGRELHSVRLRRAARDALWPTSPLPEISILLATRRPFDVPVALDQIRAQEGCRVQVRLGLHGEGWPPDTDPMFDGLPEDSTIERFDRSCPLGEILTALGRSADASLIAKWDDDDWYGRDHLADLARAYDYSGADVVGKAAEFVRLEASDVTVRRFEVGAESYGWTLAGGTLLTSRDWLAEIGGWTSAARGVDRAMLAATRTAGGLAFRTHGFQYVLRRRAADPHTWRVPDDHFIHSASEVRPGLDLEFADVEIREANE